MKKTLSLVKWSLPSEDYEGQSDLSRVELSFEDGKYYLEVACNDVERRFHVYKPEETTLDESRLDKKYPICVDTFAGVAYVAERLGLRLV